MYRAVLFDLDGTLVDTLPDITALMNAALEFLGYPALPREQYRSRVGWGSLELARLSLPEDSRFEVEVSALDSEFRKRYEAAPALLSAPYEGILESLAELEKRGIPLSILSNKPDKIMRPVLDLMLPDIRFFRALGVREGEPHKPDPASALEIARDLGLPPGDFLFVGDSAVDMKTARNAGMTPVGVAWGYRDPAELRAEGAVRVLERPSELIKPRGRPRIGVLISLGPLESVIL